MGAIQNSVNQMLGTAAAAATLGKHIQNQELEKQANIAGETANLVEKQAAFKNDTVEAAIAISAHEPTFQAKVGDKLVKDMSAEELNKLSDKQVDDLAFQVDQFRGGKLTQDRINRMQEASNMKDDEGKLYKGELLNKNEYLEKAYEASRELNNRIAASRSLRFDIEASRAKLAALKGDKKRFGGKK